MFVTAKTALPLAMALGLSAFAVPALAQDAISVDTMTCSQFLEQNDAGRADAVKMAMEAMAASGTDTSNMMEGAVLTEVTTKCEGMPDMMLKEAMPTAGN